MMNKERIVNHPGVYIKDAIEELGLSQSEFASRTGLSIKNVSTIINGESGITFDVALKLAAFFDNEVQGWINLQTQYDYYKNKEKFESELQEEWKIICSINKDFLLKTCNISIDKSDKEKTITEARRCFGVASLQVLTNVDMYAYCKTSVNKDIDSKTNILRNVWISIAEKQARSIECSSFDKNVIINNIPLLKTMTLKKPEVFEPELKSLLAKAGIKLVILPYLPGSNISGVTKWISSESATLVAINDCGKDADKIWFTLFHELGHAIQNRKRHITVSFFNNQIEDEYEIAANRFAMDNLINPNEYKDFVSKRHFDQLSIETFARQQKVAEFIVIGRLQKDEHIPWSRFQNKKIKYTA